MKIDVLIPTYNRLPSLILTLSGVASQRHTDLHVIVSDQSDDPVEKQAVVQTLSRIIDARGGSIALHHRTRVLGIAEQRHFLLRQARSDYVLYLDDDVFMEPQVIEKLVATIVEQRCGFVGAFPNGLSFVNDFRRHQQQIEFWEGPVQPEDVEPNTAAWDRNILHRAANAHHVAHKLKLDASSPKLYKVAWVASCILYDRRKLLEIGGFSFWHELPRFHSGEEVLVQNLLMRRWGGCAILPSGTYHAELPSTVLNARGTVDGHALDLLYEKISTNT